MSLALLVALVAPAGPAAARVIDLRATSEPKLVSSERHAFMSRVAAGGDVNGDGKADVLVSGAPGDGSGVVRVFFGPIPRGKTSLDVAPKNGFSIIGADPEDFADVAASAGDVNGDGLDDVLVGGHQVDNNGREESGTVYVVFGKTDRADVDLTLFDDGNQGDAGFRIDGPDTLTLAGREIGTVGDTDGDGLSDVFVGAVFAGSVYVVRGKADSSPVDLMTFDLGLQRDAGYRIDHHVPERSSQYEVAPAGDADGDGLGDVVLATARDSVDYDVWVVFGKADNGNVDVEELGEHGYMLDGGGGDVGMGLSTAGDVNGDGRDDVLVGAPMFNRAYVVFGRTQTSTIVLSNLGRRGFRILGETSPEGMSQALTGAYVAGGSDLDRDGLSDVVIGAPEARRRDRRNSGSAYVVFGKPSTRRIRLDALGRRGIRIDGERRFDYLGQVPALAGDVTGDGRPDVLVGARGATAGNAGQVHVVSHRLLFPRR